MHPPLTQKQAIVASLRQLFAFYLLFIAIFFSGRALLFALYYDRIADAGVSQWFSFLLGLQMDTIVACIILALPVLLLFTAPRVLGGPVRTFIRVYLLVFLLAALFIENATFPFFAEFDVRPNDIFLNYLDYPKEVFGNIWATYKLKLLVAAIMMSVAGYLFWTLTRKTFEVVFEIKWPIRLLLLLPLVAVLFIGIRSSFSHRAANISLAVYTDSHVVNEITKNSLYSIGYAYYSQKKHGVVMSKYGKMPLKEAYERVSRQLRIPVGDMEDPFRRTQPTHFPSAKPKNLVIFLQESLGAQFVGALGGEKGVTPNIDRLAGESIFFDHLYSNGTRSVRGIAGSVSGFLPVPGKGVVKRNKSQEDFFTVASLLKPYGYRSSFIYGGASNFDNMRGWFYGNSFDVLIDQPEFKNPAFTGIWGVCDEDLVVRANEEFAKWHAEGKPFVSVLFSTTNHTPFEFPGGRIDLIPGKPKNSVENAIKFADYAIGKLIDDAKREGYYDDTVFMILADHNVRTYGDDLIPVPKYRIMGMILGGGIKPQRVAKRSTQPDVLATALDAVGLDLTYPILGKSLFEDPEKEMVLMQFHDMYALRNGDKLAVVQPDTPALTFDLSAEDHLTPAAHNPELERDTTAFIHVINDLYQHKRFKAEPGEAQ
ncbi:sulfatase-like hydrolase/transferase [Sulfurimonas sp. HSL-3221]|uniref:LTA synthase family protein n=1 Tax=Sulfurimonadaceae TaxID=2771471 RepID=UPI001E5501C1|nr:alkaline phosphatase family protein [Sulfurimonas sp. HSL-3221]UFS62608.1 sulfatase-like hydrolase/transferase [Sulfurimonas sp. HSL-3221]